jgi:hypothetical protein
LTPTLEALHICQPENVERRRKPAQPQERPSNGPLAAHPACLPNAAIRSRRRRECHASAAATITMTIRASGMADDQVTTK